MTNEESAVYQPVRYEENPTKLPSFSNALFKSSKNGAKVEQKKPMKDNFSIKTKQSHDNVHEEKKKNMEHSDTNTHSNFGYEDKKGELLYECSKVAALEKKLKYIEGKVNKIALDTSVIYETLKKKMEKAEFKDKRKEKKFENVHKRIKQPEG